MHKLTLSIKPNLNQMKKLTIPASDGYNLGALIGQSGETTLGYVVISPATAVKKEFYIPYAGFLICHGYIVVLFDYRGVGESLSCELSNSDAYIHEWGTLDMNAVVNFLVHKKGFKEIIWIGHSIGAQLTGFIKNTKHVKKVIAINAAVGYWGYFPFPKKWLIWSLWYLISPALVWLYGYGTMKIVG